MKNIPRLLQLLSTDINGYDSDDDQGRNGLIKEEFLRLCRAVAKQLAKDLGMTENRGDGPNNFDIRTNRSGVAGSGSVTLHGEHIYIQLEQGSFRDRFMFRSCEGRKDYTGGPNQWMKWTYLHAWDKAVATFARFNQPKFVICEPDPTRLAEALAHLR